MPTAPKTFRLTPSVGRQEKSRDTVERCKKYRTKAWATIREEVVTRDGMQCQLCGVLCISKGMAHVDHVKAVVDGGTDDEANLRTLCASCHSRRTVSDQR